VEAAKDVKKLGWHAEMEHLDLDPPHPLIMNHLNHLPVKVCDVCMPCFLIGDLHGLSSCCPLNAEGNEIIMHSEILG
jgi:hypothetical protein